MEYVHLTAMVIGYTFLIIIGVLFIACVIRAFCAGISYTAWLTMIAVKDKRKVEAISVLINLVKYWSSFIVGQDFTYTRIGVHEWHGVFDWRKNYGDEKVRLL